MSTPEQYLDIPLDQLHDSPTQPRLTYDEAYLDELAADIKSHGRNLSPLLVRPRVPALFAAVGDDQLARDATAGYEIVFGHCRRRALERAGLATARCEVRTMTDQEVERAQISENLARKNVHPFEEAQGFQALITRHGDTPDAIAERTGKSRTYVYSRLKLLEACDEVRKACVAGEIGAEVALLIARLRHDKLQGKALARIKAKAWDLTDGGARSFRNIRDLLNEEFTLDLKAAPFPIDVVLAGSGPCPTCPKRSANAPEYQDVAEAAKRSPYSRQNLGPNVCTDPTCFASRKAAHFANQAAELRAAGKVVIDGNKARTLVGADGKVKGGYVPLSSVKDEFKRAKAKLGGVFAPTQVVIQCPRTGKTYDAVKESDLVEAGVRSAPSSKAAPRSAGGHNSEQAKRERAEREDLANAKTARNKRWFQAVRQAATLQARSEFDLRLICHHLLERADDNGESGLDMLLDVRDCRLHELRGQIELLPANELALLALDIVLAEGCEVDSWSLDSEPTALTAAAAHYGIDLQAIDAEAADTPPLAARQQRHGRRRRRWRCARRQREGWKPGRLRRQGKGRRRWRRGRPGRRGWRVMGPTRNMQRAIARANKADLLARMPRAFRPKLSRNQVLDLGLCHVVNLDDIAAGRGTYQTMWDWVSSVLTWHHVAQALQMGVDELEQQLQVCMRLIERYGRTGRVGFDGPDYQLAKAGLDVMDQLAQLVDRPTAIAAADWSEARLSALQRGVGPT